MSQSDPSAAGKSDLVTALNNRSSVSVQPPLITPSFKSAARAEVWKRELDNTKGDFTAATSSFYKHFLLIILTLKFRPQFISHSLRKASENREAADLGLPAESP